MESLFQPRGRATPARCAFVLLAVCECLARTPWKPCGRPDVTPAWDPSFPPRETIEQGETAAWLADNLPPMKPADPVLTTREKQLAKMSAQEYIAARKQGDVTCVEYARVLTKRMRYYQYMNAFMYWDNMPNQTDYVIEQAMDLDAKAVAEGVDAIGPLFGLPVPAKGTMSTVDFPSSAGTGLLHNCYGREDAEMVKLVRKAHGIILGKTNLPEFASAYISGNYANGLVLNPYDHSLITGGSSGGAASAVATHLCPLALAEDTVGSTREPAYQNQLFGYDPSRNHFPNGGNPGWTFTQDQVGLHARSLDDILLFDAAVLGKADMHEAKAAEYPLGTTMKVGLPRHPFMEYFNGTGWLHVAPDVEAKYEEAKSALSSAGMSLVHGEWPEYWSNNSQPPEEAELWFQAECHDQDDGWGIIAQWVDEYLAAPLSNVELKADIEATLNFAAGEHVDSREEPLGRGQSHETSNRRAISSQGDVLRLWNSYFDRHGVDMILAPPQLADAVSYVDAAGATIPLNYTDENGTRTAEKGVWEALSVTYQTWKCAPIPKLIVPTGLDQQGRPTAVGLFGRGMPPEKLFDDKFAVEWDLDFLYRAKVLVEAIHSKPSLRRAHAPLVADIFGDPAVLV